MDSVVSGRWTVAAVLTDINVSCSVVLWLGRSSCDSMVVTLGMSVRAAAGHNQLPLTDSAVPVTQRSCVTVCCQQL